MARDFRPKGARDAASKPASAPKPKPQAKEAAPAAPPAHKPWRNTTTTTSSTSATSATLGKPKSHTTFDDDGHARAAPAADPFSHPPRPAGPRERRAGPEPAPLFAAFHSPSTPLGPAKAVKGSMLVPPQSLWLTSVLAPLPEHLTPAQQLDDATVHSLRSRAQDALASDNRAFSQLLRDSGKRKEAASLGALGTLSAGDARFISDLLYSSTGENGKSAATLSDRISALTLLIQSSPLHNLETLDKLFAMVRKRSRHESGPATRSIVDWLASSGGLGGRKLVYFRDQPDLPRVASLARSASTPEESRAVDQRLALFAYEDELKKFYLHFLHAIEVQTHDPLPFVRIAAVGHAYHLLRDQSEQEHNVLRLLVTKLGDPDRTVAAKVSSHLLGLLTAHPAMKPIVVREVAEEMQRARATAAAPAPALAPARTSAPTSSHSPSGPPREAKANVHAQYYGVITLNQTVLTAQDTAVATALVALYFELFDALIAQGGLDDTNDHDEGKEEKGTDQKPQEKNRWRDSKGGKKGKKGAKGGKGADNKKQTPVVSALSATEAHGRMLSALLAGMRRAFPFADIPQSLLDKHVETLFRVTHTGSVTMAVQALQLLFQLVLVKNDSSKDKAVARSKDVAVSLGPLTDRFYRTLYDSLLDSRLGAGNKQAMYLNLLFRAIKADPETQRAKALVKRLTQVLAAGMDPSFVCGALYLLSELVRFIPGLGSMLTDPEDGEPEHFVDAPDPDEVQDQDQDAVRESQKPAFNGFPKGHKTYDPKKREPRYAGAETTCWWDILPLTQHYHPSVALNARQLVQGAKVTSNGDLSLHTLTHFLDRFVYRNPKTKHTGEGVAAVVPLRGGSAMQPSVAALRLGMDSGAGVVNLRRSGLMPSEDVRSEAFARKRPEQVAPDQAFFHKYFTTKAAREPAPEKTHRRAADEEEDDSDMDSELGLDEEQVWAAMRRTLPSALKSAAGEEEEGDAEDDLGMYDYSSDEEGAARADDTAIDAQKFHDDDGAEQPPQQEDGTSEGDEDEALEAGDVSSVSDEDSDPEGVLEDEEDLLPFADFAAAEKEADGPRAGQKRAADDEEDPSGLSKSQLARRERKKRKAVPMFASVDDYAHLLASDDEDNLDG